MKIALVTDHVGPLSAADADAYPADPAVRVLPLAKALAGQGPQVTVYARQDSSARADTAAPWIDAPWLDTLCPGVTVSRVPAGPQERFPAEMLLPHTAALAGQLADRWRREAPDVIHAQSWTSGLAALAGARGLDIPVVQTFQSLGAGVRPGRVLAAAGVAARARLEAAIGRSAPAVLASTADERAHLGRPPVPPTPRLRFARVPGEAMACGPPVVASEDAAPGDAIIHGNTGFLVPTAEPADLARRIRQLLVSPMLLDGYGIAAASRVRSRYSWERIAQETLAVYEDLLAPRMEAPA